MSAHRDSQIKRMTAADVFARKGREPLVCLTAYTTPIAEILDEVCDVLLVGDSVGMVMHGLPNTIGVTVDMMIMHGQAVMRGASRALVVIDLPFGAYEGAPELAYANAVRILKETGAAAVKVEGGPTVPSAVAYLVQRGIPVMGHVGLRPQSVLVDGGFRAKGKSTQEYERVLHEASEVDAAGAFAVVVEGVAEPLAREITQSIRAPTIGIGASAGCDGQILVTDDMLGLFDWTPKFVRRYSKQREEIGRAVSEFADDVRSRRFPAACETYFNADPAAE